MSTLKEDLAQPSAYPAPQPSAIELMQTHISWVFCGPTEVYKVKKPVDLGFLDFRTLEKRKIACEAEVALNARLAPDVYLGVVPVMRGADGQHRVDPAGGEGEIVDWAVHMRRLSDDYRADELVARGELSLANVDRIATHVAEFHARSPFDPLTARHGSRDAVTASVNENFEQMRVSIADYLAPEEASEIERWQRGFLEKNEELFDRRIASERIRDGHGDLRLEHVYVEPERLTVIDCIEFNDRFRYADVCADIAFLSMDLTWHGAVDLAERLLARYARDSGDFDLYAMVDFYESYRAYVRGKVSHFLAADADADLATRERAAKEARRYFVLALSTDRRALLNPAVIAVGGIIASGKSTIADALAAEMSAPVIDADRTRKQLLGVEPEEPIHDAPWTGAYDPAFGKKVYEEVLRRAEVVLRSGRPVVIDASFRSVFLRRSVRELATKHGVPFRFIECRVAPEVARARLVTRAESSAVSDGRVEIFDDFVAHYEAVTELPPEEHVVVDTSRPLETNLEELRARVDTWPRGFVT